MANNIQLTVGKDGVATVRLDVDGRSMNVFTPEFTQDLQDAVNQLRSREDIVGAVITSGKTTGFMAGADLLEFAYIHDRGTSPDQASDLVLPAAQALRALETCGKPVAVAINGVALGGGYELCLACHYRVLLDSPKAVVGLPEVTVGLLPAGGGTQRLPRLIGVAKALPLLLTGRHVAPAEALKLGLVNELASADEILEKAHRWVLANAGWQQPWDRKGFAVPGGTGAMAAHSVESFSIGMAKLRRDTQDNLPAPPAILSAVYEGSQVPLDRAFEIERAYFGELLAGPVARNLMRTMFINKGAAKKIARRPFGVPTRSVRKLGVLGAGMMGAGIAQVAASAGIEVVLIDRDQEAADSGRSKILSSYARDVKAGRASQADVEARLARVTATADFHVLRGCDMVVEAVFEDRQVKADVYQKTLKGLGALAEDFLMASNTSTLPVSGLADNWPKPEDFIGLHFFSPVERMPLVEVIMGKKTSQQALARALDLVKQLSKVPIVVNDSPGFYTSRIFCAYVDEGMAMVAEGVNPALIENAARQAGFATSPLAVTDEVSLDLQKLVIDQAHADKLPSKFLRQHSKPVVEAMLSAGRLGRKNGGGFYDFPVGQPKRLWAGLESLYSRAETQPAYIDVKHRLLYIQALESARCIEEGVVEAPSDADLGSILGLGYPVWTGGTISFVDTVGPADFVRECDRLADLYGERFRPSAWLRERSQERSAFYELPAQP